MADAVENARSGTRAGRDPYAGGDPLTVAVTGPTGTFGFGLIPLLQAEPRVARIVGVARRPFDPLSHGWTKMTYRRGDVRDPEALAAAFAGADVVVHLAFMITGTADRRTTRAINVDGTLNAFRAAVGAGVRRFVHASSVAAYGFYPDTPALITETRPPRRAARLFYAQEKAELEELLAAEVAAHPQPQLYLVRPPVVVGPHTLGAKELLPGRFAGLGRRLLGGGDGRLSRLPVPLPVLVPRLPLQLIHEQDVGRALLLCALGAGPPGAYNIAGDGVVTAADVAREFGLLPVPLPAVVGQVAARALTALPWPPLVPQVAGWLEAAVRPVLMDAGKARRDLGWTPLFTGREALAATFGRRAGTGTAAPVPAAPAVPPG